MLYIQQVVRLHGVPISIISDRGVQCTTQSGNFSRMVWVQSELKHYFHPQTYGQATCTIQTSEYMLRDCVIALKGNWDDHLPLIEFVYNNNYHLSIQMAPYEALYGRRYKYYIRWFNVCEAGLIGQCQAHQAMEKVKVIQERMKTA